MTIASPKSKITGLPTKNVLVVVGARPNFMKAAPIMRQLKRHGLEASLVHTGQHYDDTMSDAMFRDLELPRPDENLNVGSGSHAAQTAQVMLRFEPVLLQHRPDWLVVVGDVNSTMACTLVASKVGIKVAHVEAGLRSFDRRMPEEINRLVTDALADLLLTPSADADQNLRREGIPEARILQVGNVMIDTLCANIARARARETWKALRVEPRHFVYVTLHRPSNVDGRESLTGIAHALLRLAERLPVVFPVHPRTRERLHDFDLLRRLEEHTTIRLSGPLSYLDSLCLASTAACVLTDSGGLQEETTHLHIPCLTLRDNTERPITITRGSNRLTALERLDEDMRTAISQRGLYEQLPDIPLWDGKAGERIVAALLAR